MISSNNNPRGILLILIGMAMFSVQDALIKFIYQHSALYELYFGRTLTALILLLLYIFYSKEKLILKTSYPFLTCIRVIFFFFGFSFFLCFFNIYVISNGKCTFFF